MKKTKLETELYILRNSMLHQSNGYIEDVLHSHIEEGSYLRAATTLALLIERIDRAAMGALPPAGGVSDD